jgi:hypothetical protein
MNKKSCLNEAVFVLQSIVLLKKFNFFDLDMGLADPGV